jgi:murein DD-endopeptidase MepM/ murein hydrolase activator NlpD
VFFFNINKSGGFGRIGLVLILPFVLLIITYAAYQLFFIADPLINGMENFDYLPADKTVKLDTEGVRSIEISVYQEGKKVDVLKDTPETAEKLYSLQIKPRDMGLTDGRAIVTVKAKAGILKKVQYDIESVIDTVPPVIEVLSAPSTINQGSGGFAVLRAKGEESVFIKLVYKDQSREDKVFRAYAASVAERERPGQNALEAESKLNDTQSRAGERYHCFFPAPFDIVEGSVFYALATDAAGNRSVKALPTRLKMKKFSKSSINIDDQFINTVISSLLNETNITDPAGAFRTVNEEWRLENNERLTEIAENTEPEILWKGRFLQMRNSKVMATYGDRRTYIYKGKPVSKSVHLGYDLASFAQAPVEAANSGIVRFTGDLGIYGKTVIIDHGLGFMSIYGHLSMIAVSEGQEVMRGEIIANSGASGLAGGDHLHFGLLMHGYAVSPLYFWDSHWIRINISDTLEQ